MLRIAADLIQRTNTNVTYFPSYEIVASPFHGNQYYHDDRRSVTETAIKHVMKVFFRHFAEDGKMPMGRFSKPTTPFERPSDEDPGVSEQFNRMLCDEEMLDA